MSWAERLRKVEAERDAALAVIEKARRATYDRDVREALATVDTSALAARDAEKWREGYTVHGTYQAADRLNPYRSLAEKGPNTPETYWHGAGCEEDDRG